MVPQQNSSCISKKSKFNLETLKLYVMKHNNIGLHHIVFVNIWLSWTDDNTFGKVPFKAPGLSSDGGQFEVIGFSAHGAGDLIDDTVYPKKYAHGFCFAALCCGYTLTDFPISIRLTSLALWQSNDCPSASKATLMNMDKYFMWIHYERLHNHNKAKHNKTVCIFLGIYCTCGGRLI